MHKKRRNSALIQKNIHAAIVNLDLINAYLVPFAREIKAELDKIGYSNEYYILQIKEKYNSLRWYANGTTEEI